MGLVHDGPAPAFCRGGAIRPYRLSQKSHAGAATLSAAVPNSFTTGEEELTLHAIALQKDMDAQKAFIEEQRKALSDMKTELETMRGN